VHALEQQKQCATPQYPFCCKATTLATREELQTPMWRGDGNAVGERPSRATKAQAEEPGSRSVVSTSVRKRCIRKRPD
jgi:hypothetical protein